MNLEELKRLRSALKDIAEGRIPGHKAMMWIEDNFATLDSLFDTYALHEWQPIETAPKDGTEILVCGPDVDGREYQDVTAWPSPAWGGEWPPFYMAYAEGPPTHWVPLPAPPKGDAA